MSLRGFKFSLETPLKVKKIHKRQLEGQLIDAENKMNAQMRILDQLETQESQLYSELTILMSNGTKAGNIKNKSLYLKCLAKKIHHCQLEWRRLRDVYQDLQNKLIKLLNEIDMLQKLKDKKIKEYLKEIQKQEEKALEERINYKSSIQGGKMYG